MIPYSHCLINMNTTQSSNNSTQLEKEVEVAEDLLQDAQVILEEWEEAGTPTAPYSSCYGEMLGVHERWEQSEKAKMRSRRRKSRNAFRSIRTGTSEISTGDRKRRVVLAAKDPRGPFTAVQLKGVVEFLYRASTVLLFYPTSPEIEHVQLIYWASTPFEEECEIRRYIEQVKRDIMVDHIKLKVYTDLMYCEKRHLERLHREKYYMEIVNENVICNEPPNIVAQYRHLISYWNSLTA